MKVHLFNGYFIVEQKATAGNRQLAETALKQNSPALNQRRRYLTIIEAIYCHPSANYSESWIDYTSYFPHHIKSNFKIIPLLT